MERQQGRKNPVDGLPLPEVLREAQREIEANTADSGRRENRQK